MPKPAAANAQSAAAPKSCSKESESALPFNLNPAKTISVAADKVSP